MTVDTNPEAVERLAGRLEHRAGTRLLDGVILPEAAATLRALAAERDALAGNCQDAVDAWTAANLERDAAHAEVERLRAVMEWIAQSARSFTSGDMHEACAKCARAALAQPADPHAVAREVAKRRAGVCAELAGKEGGE